MNTAADQLMTDTATVWDAGEPNQYGQVTYSAPYTIACNHTEGGKINRAQDGDEFMPMGTFRTFDERPVVGSVMILGDHTDKSTPQGIKAFPVRRVITKTEFLDWRKRYTFLTG